MAVNNLSCILLGQMWMRLVKFSALAFCFVYVLAIYNNPEMFWQVVARWLLLLPQSRPLYLAYCCWAHWSTDLSMYLCLQLTPGTGLNPWGPGERFCLLDGGPESRELMLFVFPALLEVFLFLLFVVCLCGSGTKSSHVKRLKVLWSATNFTIVSSTLTYEYVYKPIYFLFLNHVPISKS